MTTLAKVKKVALSLTPAERILLVQDIWDSITEEPRDVEIPDWHRKLLDERLRAHKRDPSSVTTWPEMKRKLQRKLARARARKK